MSGMSKSIGKIVALVVGIVVLVGAVMMMPRPQPLIEMGVSITPAEFNTSQQSDLTLTIKSNDRENPHNIEVKFTTFPLVHLLIGASELIQTIPDSGNYSISILMQPSEKTEQPFVVRVPELQAGVASQKLSMKVDAIADGNIVSTQKIEFTVDQS